jgi:glycosyltransferase involved in cell wall biosynthesis
MVFATTGPVESRPALRRRLRIAVVTETYPPEVNGVAMTVARVVEGLRERGHALQLVRPRQHPAAVTAIEDSTAATRTAPFEELLLRGLPIPCYPHLKMGLPSKATLLKHWRERRPDIVHIATEGPLGWSALQAAAQLSLPVCSDFRTNFQAYSRHYRAGWLRRPILAYLRAFHNRTLCTMVPTAALQRELAGAGFERLTVLARGVDTQRFDPARRSSALRRLWGAGQDTRVVLCVGRLAPEKNLGSLLDAFDAMRRISPDLKLVLVGDGPSRASLQARCPDAIFVGARSGDDLAAHYASGDLFVFPSLTETFGNVTLEAMASGLAVLAYDCAAAAQLIDPGINGRLAPMGDRPALLRQAEALVADRDQAAAMGARARATACGLGWQPIMEQIEAVYAAALQQETAAAPLACAHSG